MEKSTRTCFALVALFIACAATLPAEESGVPAFPDASGPELWIDGPDAIQLGTSSGNPDVAVDNTGTRIHVWNMNGGGFSQDIALRRWDSVGNPLEDPKPVNTTTANIQRYPRVAVSADGTFLVIWQSWEVGPAERIFVRSQAYDADGNTVGTEQLLSTLSTAIATSAWADVAALRTSDGSAGGYAVVWQSANTPGADPGHSIQGCLVSATGVPSPQFQVNSDNGSTQTRSSVTELIDGGFLAVWVDGDDVFGRRFNAAGGPVGNDFQITTFATADASLTHAAIGWNGKVLIVWEDDEDGPSGKEIRGRLYDADLNALGPDFRINNVTVGGQDHPRIADYGAKGFLVIWSSAVASGADLGVSIEARVVSGPNAFDANGDGVDNLQVQYNIWDNENSQFDPGAHGWYGRLSTPWDTLTWDGEPEPDNINDQFIIGRDIEHCVFCSDFDWFSPGSPGSLWRWTSTVGVVP